VRAGGFFGVWRRLGVWLVAERDFVVWRSGLESARRQWERSPEETKSDALLMGLPLARASEWVAKRPHHLSATMRAFIGSSVEVEERKQAQARALRDQALSAQSRFLADQARQQAERGNHATAVAVALEALPDHRRGIVRPYIAAAEAILYFSVTNFLESLADKHRRDQVSRLFSGDNPEQASYGQITERPVLESKHYLMLGWGRHR